jgi:hydroxymethylglutaryl-CoA lyase
VIACPYDGPTDPAQVAKVARDLIDMGCYEVSLGDTIGVGTPDTVSAMLSAVLNQIPAVQLAGHFHDTNGQALSNIDVALEHGLRIFDAAIGGLGGCPYAPGSKGNVATELVHAALSDGGFVTGLNGDILRKASQIAQSLRQEVGQRDHVS